MTTWLAALPLPDHDCCILDTSFGDAHRFLAAWHHWRLKPDAKGVLRFIAISSELEPQALEQALTQLPPNLAPLASQFLAHWPLPLPGLHQLTLDNGRVELTLVLSPPLRPNPLDRIHASCDVIWAPHSSPTPHAAHLARLSKPETALWSDGADPEAALRFEKALVGSGFAVTRAPERPTELTATFRGTRSRNIGFYHSVAHSHEALVVGAGLAGTAAAAGLARRGWKITVLERHALPAQGASGNLAAVLSPMLSKDDGLAAQLSRASFLHLIKELRAITPTAAPGLWEPCGKLQIARTAKEEDSFQELIDHHQYPKEYVQFLTRSEASADLGHPVAAGALLFPEGGWVNPKALCEARLCSSPNIEMRGGHGVLDITYANDRWRATGAHGVQLGEAPVLILANAYEAQQFAPARLLHLKKVRGQVTHIPEESIPQLHRVLSRDGYLTPPIDGVCSLGATYDFDDERPEVDPEGHRSNLARLPELLHGYTAPLLPISLTGRVSFRSLTADRLPMIGALPKDTQSAAKSTLQSIERAPGIYSVLGMGSRGLLWSALAGEILAAQLNGQPAPVSTDLLNAIDPARFLIRKERKAAKPTASIDE